MADPSKDTIKCPYTNSTEKCPHSFIPSNPNIQKIYNNITEVFNWNKVLSKLEWPQWSN